MSIEEEYNVKRVTRMLEKVPSTDEWDSVPHTDIDVGDETDPQLCFVYVNDIYSYLRESEVRVIIVIYSHICSIITLLLLVFLFFLHTRV